MALFSTLLTPKLHKKLLGKKLLGVLFINLFLLPCCGNMAEATSQTAQHSSNHQSENKSVDQNQKSTAGKNAQDKSPQGIEYYPEIDDMTFGSEDAKVALIEYSSINCTHCADYHGRFHQAFYKEFVETGKIHYVLKHFPLDFAAVEYMSLIVKEPQGKWFPLFEKALATQKQWVGKPPKVLAKILGVSKKQCEAALKCEKTRALIMAKRFNAEQSVDIQATPTFLIVYKKNDKGELGAELYNQGVAPEDLSKRLRELYKKYA